MTPPRPAKPVIPDIPSLCCGENQTRPLHPHPHARPHLPCAGGVTVAERAALGELVHTFSHIRMTLKAERIVLRVGTSQAFLNKVALFQ